MKRSLFHPGGAALPASGAPPVDEEAKRWLERMLQATQNLNYEGTFIYVQGPHIEAMRIAHGGGEGGERQRLVSLTGPTVLDRSDPRDTGQQRWGHLVAAEAADDFFRE